MKQAMLIIVGFYVSCAMVFAEEEYLLRADLVGYIESTEEHPEEKPLRSIEVVTRLNQAYHCKSRSGPHTQTVTGKLVKKDGEFIVYINYLHEFDSGAGVLGKPLPNLTGFQTTVRPTVGKPAWGAKLRRKVISEVPKSMQTNRHSRPRNPAICCSVVRDLCSDLQHKNGESIAYLFGLDRKAIQHFLGESYRSDAPIREELAKQIGTELGEFDGVIAFDPSAFAKSGDQSVGVARQWCGRLGKIENCQVGIYMAYVSSKGHATVRQVFPITKFVN
ncbi:transposase [Gimesia maris]|jgi:hypothetical protein|uniref:transposase n=1 Tax=Gimesia maris TaxID=122 RepID=UPI0030D7F6CC|tara:strand:+ start:4765 stop:5592 length:828 start_codon:yes stop_codon:yes gene_type:complete